MSSVKQSGRVTPGHMVFWTTDGVIQDGGVLPTSTQVLASSLSTNFNTTADQLIAIPRNVTAFQITGILITNASVSLTTARGGFYPAASKGGTPIVEATQAYTLLTGRDFLLYATLSSFGQNSRFSTNNLGVSGGHMNVWFSLTTPQGANASADIYVIGMNLP